MADQQALINAMTSRGHTTETANAAIAGRGYDDLAREYLGSTGGSSSGTGSYDTLLSNMPSALDFAKTQEAGISSAFNNLVMAQRAQKSPLDIYTELEKGAGLPEQQKLSKDLRGQIFNLQGTIDRVKPVVAETTRESYLTEGQRENLVNAKQQPLLESLTKLTSNYANIQQSITELKADLTNKAQLFMQGQEQALEPYKLGYQALVDQSSRLMSAFGIDSQNQLEISLQKIRRGEQLDDREAEQAFTLLQGENSYMQSLRASAAGMGIKVSESDTTEDLLQKIGEQAAADIAYDRRDKSGGTSDPSKYYNNPTNQNNQTSYNSPPMSAPAGTTQEYPQGSGVYWISTGGGWQ